RYGLPFWEKHQSSGKITTGDVQEVECPRRLRTIYARHSNSGLLLLREQILEKVLRRVPNRGSVSRQRERYRSRRCILVIDEDHIPVIEYELSDVATFQPGLNTLAHLSAISGSAVGSISRVRRTRRTCPGESSGRPDSISR